MGDVIRYTEGDREYAVYGLEAKAASIRAAARGVDDALDRWKTAGDAALATWRGPHSATMVAQHGQALDEATGLHASLSITAMRLALFPASFTPSSTVGSSFSAARAALALTAPDADGSVGAEPAGLRSYARTVQGSSVLFPVRAGVVDHDGLRAEVTYPRGLTESEVRARVAAGATVESLAGTTVPVTEPYPVHELVPLVAPTDQAEAGRARAITVAEFTVAVADAIEAADGTRLDLLASHPELAAFLVPGGDPDVLVGDTALAVLQAHFATLDTAAEGGDPDDNVSRDDLEAAAADESLPPELRAAARYLLDNPTLHALVDTGADDRGPIAADGDITREDLDGFMTTQVHVRALDGWIDALDTASEGGEPDGYVSRDDLEAAAADASLPDDVRAAAQHLLDHAAAFSSVVDQEELGAYGGTGGNGFTATDLIGRLVNGQSYVHDPDAARDFVARLPVAADGEEGLPITLAGDDSVRALAGSALFATGGDLTETQTVIAHLPESPGAVRNQLITGFYDMLAQRVDGVMADGWGVVAGDPSAPGSGGANWLIYAPWASGGVRGAIDGSFSAFGMGPSMDQRQAAADGNQWIFNDITARFASFVELYESTGGQPSTEQVEHFFATTFSDGDAEIRAGFEAYVAALGEDDPVQRQVLMFQGNTLVATHEQAGAQPYLERVTDIPGPWNSIASEFIDLRIGRHRVEVNRDLPDFPVDDTNLVVGQSVLGLDPAGVGPGPPPGVALPPITGWSDEGFDVSTQAWYDSHGATVEEITYVDPYSGTVITTDVPVDPDTSLGGTGAGDWATYNDRMWFIHRMFEQTHADPSLYDTGWLYDEADGGPAIDPSFLPDEVEGWVTRP